MAAIAPTAMRTTTAAAIHTPKRLPPCVGALAEPAADDGTGVACEALAWAAFAPEPGFAVEVAAPHAPVEPLGASGRVGVAFQALQIAAQLGGGLVAQVAIFFEGFSDDFFQLGGKHRIDRAWRGGRAIQNGIENNRRGIAVERRLARGHFVEHRAEAEEIGARIEVLAARLFRRHVGNGADSRAGTGEQEIIGGRLSNAVARTDCFTDAPGSGLLGQSKIENFCLPAGRDEDIRGLDVAMNDAAGMGGIERIGELRAKIEQGIGGHGPAADALAKRLPFEDFHHQIRAAVVFADVVNRADSRDDSAKMRRGLHAGSVRARPDRVRGPRREI